MASARIGAVVAVLTFTACSRLGFEAGSGSDAGANGAACSSDQECASESCADNVCCETACDSACETCDASGACVPVPIELVVSRDPSFVDATDLSGEDVSGDIWVRAIDCVPMTEVRFWLDDSDPSRSRDRREASAPYDLMGDVLGTIRPLSSGLYDNGIHVIRTEGTLVSGGDVGSSAAFTISNSQPGLWVSDSSRRENLITLDGSQQSGRIYVVFFPGGLAVTSVDFFVDDPAQSGTPDSSEASNPYDAMGDSAAIFRPTAGATPLNTATLGVGTHTVTAVARTGNGDSVFTATFEVISACGDGLLDGSETCDDGETTPGDGCADTCRVEVGWFCDTQEPSRCARNDMIIVSAGTFTMGSPAGEAGSDADESQHPVTLTHDFAMSRSEVTQGEFEAVHGFNPSRLTACGPDCPVERVTWYGAIAYANELSLQVGFPTCYELSAIVCADGAPAGSDVALCMNAAAGGIESGTVSLNNITSIYDCAGYRLATEAEWEYAARAGSAAATYNGELAPGILVCEQPNLVLDSIAWFCGNAAGTTHEVGTLAPNPWGFNDMLGNVWEWTHDGYGPYPAGAVTDPEGLPAANQRTWRGGSWRFGDAASVRAASRLGVAPDSTWDDVGIRLVRTLHP